MKIIKSSRSIIMIALLVACGCGGGGSGGGGGGGNTQTKIFRVTNNCAYTIWIQQQNMPSSTPQVVKLDKGSFYDYDVPAEGVAATRFWPKTGCDTNGNNCDIGESSPVSGPCPAGGCPPPVDSKVEATWGCSLSDQTGCAVNPSDPSQRLGDTYYDTSAVDGYTLPYKMTVVSGTLNSDCVNVDCSGLDLSKCPVDENLSQGQTGTYPQYANEDLQVKNPSGGQVSGCFSPCKKLDYPGWGGEGLRNETGDQEVMYCCPTPPIDSATCRAGPVATTKYVAAVHAMCPGGGYGYAYDDNVGNHHCAPTTKFEMKICP